MQPSASDIFITFLFGIWPHNGNAMLAIRLHSDGTTILKRKVKLPNVLRWTAIRVRARELLISDVHCTNIAHWPFQLLKSLETQFVLNADKVRATCVRNTRNSKITTRNCPQNVKCLFHLFLLSR